MIGHAVQLPKLKITQSGWLFVVLLLLLSFAQEHDVIVDGLPRSFGEKIETLRKHHKPPTYPIDSAEYEEVIQARRRLSAVVGMPPAPPPVEYHENVSGQLLAKNHRYKSVQSDRSHSSSARGLGPIIVNGDNGEATTPKTFDDTDEQECILGRAHHYMAKWLNRNGTINADNSNIEGTFLDLSHNSSLRLINEIKPFLGHYNQKRLIYLSLAFSGITAVPKSELTLVNGTLSFMSLMGNVLIPFSLPVLQNLRVLDLRHCGFNSLPNKAFVNTPNLVKLFLAHNSLTNLNSNHFNGLSKLRHLDLSYINQEQLSGLIGYEQQADPYSSLTEGLDLSEDVFIPLGNLSFLDLSYTKLLSYSARAFRSVAVVQLSLCYTGIPIIVGSMMNGSLKVLDISGNPGITTAIHHDASEARGFNANLEILVCENSTVKHLQWLNGMISLKVLLLGHNNINQLTNVTFANMGALEILDLSNNHVSNWHQRVFEGNDNLFILDLSANNINVLTTEMLYDLASVEFIAIGQNSFVCHCLLREFIELAAKTSQVIACLLQSIVNQIQDLSTEDLDVDYLDDHLFSQGEVWEHAKEITSTTLRTTDKSALRLTTAVEKQPRSLQSEMTTPTTAIPPSSDELHKAEDDYNVLFRVIHSYVETMYSSTAKFQESLDKYNRNRPSSRVYRNMVNSRLTSRFFRIDCNNDTDVSEEEESDISDEYIDHPLYNLNIQIIDFDEEDYKCIDLDNSEFYLFEQERCTFDRTLLDNWNLGVASSSTTANIVKFTLMFFGFALVAFIIYISKWEYIKYFCIIVRNATVLSLLKHKNEALLRKHSLVSVGGCYMYDVFVSYSEQDRQWVLDELLPNLEKTEDISVCLHERDFQVGVSILENIIYCMDQSRTLLLVMSESFLLSHWCQFEMHLAQHRLLETRREQLILVLLEDIPKIKRSKTLQYLMKTKTYIIWPQPSEHRSAGVAANSETDDAKGKSKKEKSKKKSRNRKQQSKEKDPQSLVEERNLFWKRLRNAIGESAVWEQESHKSALGGERRKSNSSSSSTAKESTA